MAKETFENKMLNGMYDSNKPRMQFLIDNHALTLSVVKYIARHTKFVAKRCVEHEKHWQVLLNFSDFLELKKLHEQIKEQKDSGNLEGIKEKEVRFEEIKKKFNVAGNEYTLIAKRDEAEWAEFYHFMCLLDGAKQNIEQTETTNNLTSVVKKWVTLNNVTPQALLGLISETHLTYLSDNGLKGFEVEVIDGSGVKASFADKKLYVGKTLLENKNLTEAEKLNLLVKVLNATELVCVTTNLDLPLKTQSPIRQAMCYERALSIIEAIRQENLVYNSNQLNTLLTLNSATIIKGQETETTDKWFLELVKSLQPVTLTQFSQERIVEEYYKPHLEKLQNNATKLVLSAQRQAKSLK